MKEILTLQKAEKVAALEKVNDQCRKLEQEIDRFGDRKNHIALIEEALRAQYDAHRKGFPIDRANEPKINQYIKQARQTLDRLANAYQAENASLDEWTTLEQKRISDQYPASYYHASRAPYIPYYYSSTERRQMEAEYRRKEREKERAHKAQEKEKEAAKNTALRDLLKYTQASRKENQSDYIKELKAQFETIELDIKIFYAKGISQENLLLLTQLLDRICSALDSLNASVSQLYAKAATWTATAKRIPIDIERQDKENEAAAKQKLQQKLTESKKAFQNANTSICETTQALSQNEENLKKKQAELAAFDESFPQKKEKINTEAKAQEAEADKAFKTKQQELSQVCKQEEAKLQEEIILAKSALQELDKIRAELAEEKATLEAELQAAFFLAFGKKRRLREQLAENERLRAGNHEAHSQQESKLDVLRQRSPQAKYQQDLKAQEALRDQAIQKAHAKQKKKLNALNTERQNLQALITSLNAQIAEQNRTIKEQTQIREQAQSAVDTISAQLANFHTNYMLQTFGKNNFLEDIAAQKRSALAALKKTAKLYREEIASLDAELLEIQKVEATKEKLQAALPEDFYFIDEARRIFNEILPDVDPENDLLFSFKSLGFAVRKKFILKNWHSVEHFFRNVLQLADTFDLEPLKQRYGSLPSWELTVRALRAEYEILEFEPNQFISIRRLERSGVTKQLLHAFCDEVYKHLEDDTYFTIKSLNGSGFTSELYDLGFSDLFYRNLLFSDPRFSYCKMLGEVVLYKGKQDVSAQAFILAQIRNVGKIDVAELIQDLQTVFGCTGVTTATIKQNIRGTEIYYDPILDRVYATKDWYYNELDEEE